MERGQSALCSQVGMLYKYQEPIKIVKMSGVGVQNGGLGGSHWWGCESWLFTSIWDRDSETRETHVPEDMYRMIRMCPVGEKRTKRLDQ